MEIQTYEKIRPKHSGTKKMFDNPLLERLTRTHIAIPITILLSIAAFLLYYAFRHTNLPAVYIPFLFLGGFVFFTLLEYLAHRYLFHMKPDKEWKKKFVYTVHGVHHEFPKDKDRLAMPVPASLFLSGFFFVLFYALMDTRVFGFLPGVITGYCLYLFVHYIVHAYQPPKNFFKQLWVNHSMHHYKDSNQIFGVSSPFWDYVFGTYPKDLKKN
jgi:sterol desaturase/sphingolipid hydroxylase (fatty acid hydroxylase superfamily)